MQEFIELLETQKRLFIEAERHTLADGIGRTILLSKQFIEKEKEQIIDAHTEGVNDRIEYQINGAMDCDSTRSGEEYYNQKYNK